MKSVLYFSIKLRQQESFEHHRRVYMEFSPSDVSTETNPLPLAPCGQFNYSSIALSDLSQKAVDWVKNSPRTCAADTIFSFLTRITLIPKNKYAEPTNINCFRQCQLLIENVPEVHERFDQMSLVSPGWARLVERWKDIKKTMEEEAPEWRSCKGKAPRTHSMIQGLLSD